MKFQEHDLPADDPAKVALNEAVKAAVVALVSSLRASGMHKGVFLVACFDGGADMPLAAVQIASNMPPDIAQEFISILAQRDAPKIIVPH